MRFFKNNRFFALCAFTVITFASLTGCSTTTSVEKVGAVLDYSEDEAYDNEKNTFIFLRLYNPEYKNPFEVSNFLKNCISVIEVNPIKSSHASIGFGLDDDFYGLTLAGDRALKNEECNNTDSNAYMKKCNALTSYQTTFAIRVTESEAIRAQAMVDYYLENDDLRYATEQNFSVAMYSIHRKFFTRPENRRLGSKSLAKKNFKTAEVQFDETRSDFVCSNLTAYILVNSVRSVRDFFIENQIDVMNVTPSDLAMVPGMRRLFTSTWDTYQIVAKKFVNEHQEFGKYLSDVEVVKKD